MTPELASVAIFGMITSGLFQDTSPQPKSSTVIRRMLGAALTRVTAITMTAGQNCRTVMTRDASSSESNLLLRS